MCQMYPVSGVPYLCIEVHVQTFIYAFCLPDFLLEESSLLRLESKPLQERRRQGQTLHPIDSSAFQFIIRSLRRKFFPCRKNLVILILGETSSAYFPLQMPCDFAIAPPQGFTPNLLRTWFTIRTNALVCCKTSSADVL